MGYPAGQASQCRIGMPPPQIGDTRKTPQDGHPNSGAVALLVELHGRMGYFPPIVRLKPVAGALPPRYEVTEIINLQEVREQARKKR